MKKLLLTLLFCLIATQGWCASKLFIAGGVDSNWGTASNWSPVASVPADGDDVTLTVASPNCIVNVATNALKSLDMTGYLGTLSGTSNITIRGLTASTNVCKIVGIGTWTGTLIFSPVSTTAVIQLTSNGNLLTKMTVTSGAAVSLVVLQDNLSFTAAKTDSITLTTQGLDLNGFTISGNSGINRLLITSVTLGTTVTVTTSTAGSTFANCDFRDISFSNGGALDLSAITGGSGNCGGNTNPGGTLTLTTSDDWYFKESTTSTGANLYVISENDNWYTATNGGGTQMASTLVVLPQDNAYFDASSSDGTCTVDQDMPRVCKTLDFTGVGAMNFHMNNIAQTLYGGLTFVSNVTVTLGSNIIFQPRSGTFTLTSNGKTLNAVYILGSGGILQLGDTFLSTATYFEGSYSLGLNINSGTFDANDQAVNIGTIRISGGTIVMGNGTWTVDSGYNAGYSWNTQGGIITPEGSTIVFNNTSGIDGMTGGSKTYNNITINSSTYAFTFSNMSGAGASNTFSTFTINAPKTVLLTNNSTTTVATLTIVNSGTAPTYLLSTTVAGAGLAVISDSNAGQNVNDYLNVNDVKAQQTNTFYYGANGSADAESVNWLAAPAVAGGVRSQVIWLN